MAGVEKICEYSGEYEGWVMYGYKRNHIQVLKQHRHHFKDKEAYLFIVDTPEVQEEHPINRVYLRLHLFKKYWSFPILPKFWTKAWWLWRFSTYQPRHYRLWYHYVLYVPNVPGQVEGLYYNWTYTPRKAVRKLRKLVDLQWVEYPEGSTNDSLMDDVREYVAWMHKQPETEEGDE